MNVDTYSIALIFTILGLGVFITFRILNITDLTIEASYALGALLCAKICIALNPFIALLVAFLGGMVSGLITALLHTKLKINAILSGILTLTAFYSINLIVANGDLSIALKEYGKAGLINYTMFPDNDFAKLNNAAKGSIGLSALVIAGELSGFAIYKFSMIALFAVSRTLGLGLTVAGAGATFASALGVMLGPVGWGITVLSLLFSLGGTSWKKTIPSVFVVACLRKQQKYGDEQETNDSWNAAEKNTTTSYQSSGSKTSSGSQFRTDSLADKLFRKGKMFDIGDGVGKDKKLAFEYYKQAAELGHPEAQYNLAQLYEFGQGVKEDRRMAKEWYTKAANQGLEAAKRYLVRF